MNMGDTSTVVKLKRKSTPVLDEKSELMDLSKDELIKRILTLKQELAKTKSRLSSPEQTPLKKQKSKKEFDFSNVTMRPIALNVLYQGWNYNGFQVQSTDENTISEFLIKALQKTCLIKDRQSSGFTCCGRTDAAVSAFNQVITLKMRSKLKSPEESDDNELVYVKMLNNNLPKDIRVIAWSSIPERYSARFDCHHRNYKYWFPQANLNIEAMNEASKYLLGTHDFRNLCKMNVANGIINFVRNITKASVTKSFENPQFEDSGHDMCVFHISSQGFLWHQIRCIFAILLMVGQGKESPDIIQKLLDVENNPRKPLYGMVIGDPLNLYQTEFDDNIKWRYDPIETKQLLKDLHKDWTLNSIKTTMLGEMIKDIVKDSKCTEDVAQLESLHLIEGVQSQVHAPLMSRPKCESLDNRIDHYVEKSRIKIIKHKDDTIRAIPRKMNT